MVLDLASAGATSSGSRNCRSGSHKRSRALPDAPPVHASEGEPSGPHEVREAPRVRLA